MSERGRARHLIAILAALTISAAAVAMVVPASAAAPSRLSASHAGTALPSGRKVALTRGKAATVRALAARDSSAGPPAGTATMPALRQDRANIASDPGSSKLKATPLPQTASKRYSAQAAQTLGTQLLGAQASDSGFVPPDSMGAVGFTQYIAIVNGRIRSFDKGTGAADGVLDQTTNSFFSSVTGGAGTSDPRVRYDRFTGLWYFTMITVVAPNRVMLAYSDSSIITGNTTFSTIFFDVAPLHPGCLWDYDTLGVDQLALYIGGNLFCPNSYQESDGLVLSKSNLFGLPPNIAYEFTLASPVVNSCPAGDGPYTPQGVDSPDPSAVGYFVGVSACYFGKLMIVAIDNPDSSTPTGRMLSLIVPPTALPSPVPAMGSTHPLDALDDRLFAAQLRNGHLWTAHNLCVDASGVAHPGSCLGTYRDASRWYDITNLDTTPALNQAGTVFDPAATNPSHYWIPSIMVSGQGHAAMGSSVAGAAEHPEAAVMGRLQGDILGNMSLSTVYQTSAFAYNAQVTAVQRWGDYSYTSLDPNDDMTMWTIQEFANATNSWGVKAVQVMAPLPAMPISTDGTVLYTNQCSQVIKVNGSGAGGKGFFDPGPGFQNHIAASATGGVTVNSVTYIDPLTISLDLSTQGATAGLKNLTITNPDGQSITAANFLSVTGPSTKPDIQTGASNFQYTNLGSDGVNWQEMDSALQITCTPAVAQSILLTANADLFTANAGVNQDLGIFVQDGLGADQLLAWKESGGFAGTFSPNAAFVQVLFPMVATHIYTFKVEWKTNNNAPGSTIFAGAGTGYPFSQTSLVGESFPTAAPPNFAVSTTQYTLPNSDGSNWQDIGTTLKTTLAPAAASTAVVGGNVDLFTANAGFNQDVGIFVRVDGLGPDILVAWKESGGFAGTFSPNAAFVKGTYPMTATHSYEFKLKWKTNKNGQGATILAGAGIAGAISPTSLVAQSIPNGLNPYQSSSTSQYTLADSNGAAWTEIDTGLQVSVTAATNANSVVGANIDLFTAASGFNQDIGIFVNDGSGDQLLAWKESGGFAGTFSPNAAFVQTEFRMVSGQTYVFKLMWKTNRGGSATILAGAGPISPAVFSPSRLTVELSN